MTDANHPRYTPHSATSQLVIIALDDLKPGMDKTILEVYQYLQKLGVEEEKIILQSFKSLEHHVHRFPRKVYLTELSEMMHKNNIHGDVAECGVYRGWFASVINDSFPNETFSNLYTPHISLLI